MMDKKMIVTLKDEKGNNIDYELLDIISYNKNVYTVFYPTEKNDTEVLIFRVLDIPNSDDANYILETDDKVANEVYKKFKEKYHTKALFADNKRDH